MTTNELPTSLEGGPFGITTQELSKRYGDQVALQSVSLQVPEGSVYLLVGPNGAGKSTLIRTLLDLTRPTTGSATVFGLRPREDGPALRARIGYVPERQDWGYGWMRVERLLRHHAAFFPSWDQGYAERLVRFFEIPVERRFGKLSKGQARRVQLLMALAHRPPLLILDEPTDGLDPVMRDEVVGLLAEHFSDSPTTVLISTHLVHETETLADHVGVLRNGQLREQLTVADLRRGLQRYRVEVPDGWTGIASLNGAVVRRKQNGREVQWTVWGDERQIVEHFTRSGATVREAAPLTLEEATLALLSRKDDQNG